jgi:chitodextrinase
MRGHCAAPQLLRNGESIPLEETTETHFSDTTVAASTTYSYEIKVVDAADKASRISTRIFVTTIAGTDTAAPTAPGTAQCHRQRCHAGGPRVGRQSLATNNSNSLSGNGRLNRYP